MPRADLHPHLSLQLQSADSLVSQSPFSCLFSMSKCSSDWAPRGMLIRGGLTPALPS